MNEIKRIRQVYSGYDNSSEYSKLYSPFGKYSYHSESLLKELYHLFIKYNFLTLKNKKILEIGCGTGNNFTNYLKFGVQDKDIYGLDLIIERLLTPKKIYKNVKLINNDSQFIPFKSKSFDIIFQFVVFSSILDDNVCKNIASEMLRVLKDDGMIIWYDAHGGKMMSEHTRSFSENQIKKYFPNCKYEFKRIIPKTQLSLRLSKYSWGWLILDIISYLLPWFNCMQLCVIKRF